MRQATFTWHDCKYAVRQTGHGYVYRLLPNGKWLDVEQAIAAKGTSKSMKQMLHAVVMDLQSGEGEEVSE